VGFKPVADTIPETLQKVKFIALPDLDLEPFGALPADLDQAKQTFSTTRLFAVQLFVASTESFAEDHPVKHVQMQGFKNYRLVPMDPRFPSALAFAKALGDSCVLMPADAIWNDKYRGQLLTISVNKSSDAVTVARELRATVPFIYICSKNSLRLLFPTSKLPDDILKKITSVKGVASVSIDSEVVAGKAAKFQTQKPTGYRREDTAVRVEQLDVKVSTVTSVPIAGDLLLQCKSLLAFVGCEFLRTTGDGCVWVRAGSVERAEMLHERCASGFRFCWAKAPQADN
jgi:hypothetical protein